MLPLRQHVVVFTWIAVSAIAGSGVALAQEAKSSSSPARARKDRDQQASAAAQRITGVVVKLEPYRKTPGGAPANENPNKETRRVPHRVRLTINTAAAWSDFVRDQAANPAAAKDAKASKGDNAVAIEGEPISPESLVVIDVGSQTRLLTHFRSSTDETDSGAKTVARAEANEQDPAEISKPGRSTRASAKPREITVADLKKGVFIEAEYRRVAGLNEAASVIVLKPIGGPDTSAKESEPK